MTSSKRKYVGMGTLYYSDNLPVLGHTPAESIQLIYADPPFGANKERAGRAGKFQDTWEHPRLYIEWLRPRLEEFRRVLSLEGTLFLHLDRRSVHYARLALDEVFGPGNFRNEIIWHYTGGGRSERWFPHKHDNILVYSRTASYKFNADAVREPYSRTSGYARSGITSRAGKKYLPHPAGRVIDDVWSIPIINPMSRERTDYPTQKPEKLLERIISVATDPSDIVLDPFCGSGTTLVVAERMSRKWIGIDESAHAVNVSTRRLHALGAEFRTACAGCVGCGAPSADAGCNHGDTSIHLSGGS